MSKYETEQRNMLLELFKNSDHQSLSANDILKHFTDEKISISAIYRNLKQMEHDGLICKVNTKGRSEALYHYVNPHSCVGIIHLICQNCENTYHVNRHVSAMIFNMASDEFNFSITSTGTFLYGLCNRCQTTNNKEKMYE